MLAYFYSPLVKKTTLFIVLFIVSLTGIICCWVILPPHPHIGLMPKVNASAEFFKTNGLKGPIFSDYDIGGYLIYHLDSKEKVFVDNRQEAYPREFFQQVFIPMQEDISVWQKISQKYGFNIIYFYRHDMTPWGQFFIVNRVLDPQWAPVFVDNYAIILVRRGSIDQGVIDRFELPQGMFNVVHNNS